MSAYNGFKWKESGEVSAPDWQPEPRCGHGLHGLLWGCGDGGLLGNALDAKWLVVEVEAASIVELDGKVKFPKGEVIFCGDRKGATELISGRAPKANLPIVWLSITAGDRGTATAGDRGTATAGYRGTATAGDRGTATARDGGTATAGSYGTATAGSYGTATAGDRGTATAGDRGTATAGDGGTLQIKRYDPVAERHRIVTGYVGEDGIEANVPYTLDQNGKLVRKVP